MLLFRVAKISSEGGITKSQAEKSLDGFVLAVSDALSGCDKITLVGFGTFSVVVSFNVKATIPGPAKRSKFRRQKLSSSKQAGLSAKKSNSRI
jgi:DNA-binding protein HU-beta